MINPIINKKIVTLWDTYFKDREDIPAPLFHEDIPRQSLLFVGVNPSFSIPAFKLIMKDTEYEGLDPEAFYSWKNISSDEKYIDDCIKIDRYGASKYQYFKRFDEISKIVNVQWYHIDVFLFRETSQKDFVKRVFGKSSLTDFGKDQVEIFKEVLENAQPKVVVVANAYASGIIQLEFKESLIFDKERGYHLLTLNGIVIPIFFTSMLTGQRALDTGSYKRLVWHIKKAVTLIN